MRRSLPPRPKPAGKPDPRKSPPDEAELLLELRKAGPRKPPKRLPRS